jgi:hypothetical protein
MNSIRVESNAYQQAIIMDLAEDMVPVRSYNTGKEKFDPEVGINSLAMVMELGKVVIPSDPTDARTLTLGAQLANEMRSFSGDSSEHTGDGLMALWFAYSEVRALLGSRILVPGMSDQIKDSPPVHKAEDRAPMEKKADQAMTAEQEFERSNFKSLMKQRMIGLRR